MEASNAVNKRSYRKQWSIMPFGWCDFKNSQTVRLEFAQVTEETMFLDYWLHYLIGTIILVKCICAAPQAGQEKIQGKSLKPIIVSEIISSMYLNKKIKYPTYIILSIICVYRSIIHVFILSFFNLTRSDNNLTTTDYIAKHPFRPEKKKKNVEKNLCPRWHRKIDRCLEVKPVFCCYNRLHEKKYHIWWQGRFPWGQSEA